LAQFCLLAFSDVEYSNVMSSTESTPARPTSHRATKIDRRRLLGLGAGALATLGGVTSIARSSAHDGHDHEDAATPSASPAASPVTDAGTYHISTLDIRYEPKEFTIPANTDVTIVVSNEGKMQHDLVMPDFGVSTGRLNAGDTSKVKINAGPGTYHFYCSVPGHKQAGMMGTLTVE
jgi:uncharacterized cupredoxin-like copper-binding protein